MLLISLVGMALQSCQGTITARVAELYPSPKPPICVKDLPGYGLYDHRGCDAGTIGNAWVKERRLRLKYEKQVNILNQK